MAPTVYGNSAMSSTVGASANIWRLSPKKTVLTASSSFQRSGIETRSRRTAMGGTTVPRTGWPVTGLIELSTGASPSKLSRIAMNMSYSPLAACKALLRRIFPESIMVASA